MAFTKTQIITQIEHLMQQKFTSPKEAFDFYDTNRDGFLTKNDLKLLLNEAKVNLLIRNVVAEFMLQSFDKDNDGLVSWHEFKSAIKKTKFK